MVEAVGFASKQDAIDAEAKRRTEELQKHELAKAGAGPIAAALPTTLGMLFREFFHQHAEEKLAPKTIERYRELAGYLAPKMLAMPLGEITPLHLSREWTRLLKAGGVELDRSSCQVRLDGENLSLTATEFRLLEFLMSRPGVVFSREQVNPGLVIPCCAPIEKCLGIGTR